jgi:hypothetical protein
MAQAIVNRQVTALISRCYTGLDSYQLRGEVLRRLRPILSVDAAFFATVDPGTMLFTSALAEDPLPAAAPMFMDNEFGCEDVNKFAFLAVSADPVGSLDRATQGHRPDSHRYREIMAPLGLGDELRAALIANKGCWGVLCLHREDASHGFDDRDVALIKQIAPHVAEGLRRAMTAGSTSELGTSAARRPFSCAAGRAVGSPCTRLVCAGRRYRRSASSSSPLPWRRSVPCCSVPMA